MRETGIELRILTLFLYMLLNSDLACVLDFAGLREVRVCQVRYVHR